MINKVIIKGRLVNPPKMINIGNTYIAKFSVATTRIRLDKNNEKQYDTTFVDCDLFGKRAEFLGKFGQKGQDIVIEGRLRQDKWEDKNTKKNMSKLIVEVENFELVRKNNNSSENDNTIETDTKSPF